MEQRFTLSDADAIALTDELASALDDMVDTSCMEMAALWVESTRRTRQEALGHSELGFTPSKRFLALSKGVRSRYRVLACFRHAVLWQGVLAQIPDADHRRAVQAMYFTPYPDNAPPYAWSRAGARAPHAAEFASATTLKNYAKEGCWWSVEVLRRVKARLLEDRSWAAEVRARMVGAGCRETVRDALKLEDHPEWTES